MTIELTPVAAVCAPLASDIMDCPAIVPIELNIVICDTAAVIAIPSIIMAA